MEIETQWFPRSSHAVVFVCFERLQSIGMHAYASECEGAERQRDVECWVYL